MRAPPRELPWTSEHSRAGKGPAAGPVGVPQDPRGAMRAGEPPSATLTLSSGLPAAWVCTCVCSYGPVGAFVVCVLRVWARVLVCVHT